ncbi:MAG TPA: hypothetical protein VF066_17535 [Thermoleophilaceae bacterium]
MILATLVDWGALGKVVLYSFVAAVGVTTVFSVGIVGLTRFDESRRNGGGRLGYAALALVCGLIVTAVVVEAIVIMTNK